ncbi:MAG: hypothetical protein ACK4FP_04910 [Azonexus sp.]
MANAQPRRAPGRPSQAIEGVVPGGIEHRILLALRGPGGMTAEQIRDRFGDYKSAALSRLKKSGLVTLPAPGSKGVPITITALGRTLTDSAGPLNRTRNLITYCQL